MPRTDTSIILSNMASHALRGCKSSVRYGHAKLWPAARSDPALPQSRRIKGVIVSCNVLENILFNTFYLNLRLLYFFNRLLIECLNSGFGDNMSYEWR